MKIIGDEIRLFVKVVGEGEKAFCIFSTTVSRKNEDGTYSNAFMPCILSNAAKSELKKHPHKTGKNSIYYDVDVEGWLTAKRVKPKEGNEFEQVALFINSLYVQED